MEELKCHDCGKILSAGEKYFSYSADDKTFIKCSVCYKIDPVLRNFRKTEVYSRVVGYIRPVDQWNNGKAAEFGDRKEFIVTEGVC
jgi:anaerobic ribonucleoside-triphosphate reductase